MTPEGLRYPALDYTAIREPQPATIAISPNQTLQNRGQWYGPRRHRG